MKARFGWIAFIALLLLSAFSLLSTSASAEPTKVNVGLYILNLGKFDVATGGFTADFYLSMTCEEECNPTFEFLNGRATSIDKIIDEPTEKFYRIQATLASPVDLQRFPFDTQHMHITIEDKTQTVEDLVFVPLKDQSGIDETITFTGWHLDSWDTTVKDHTYTIYDETYSQYDFSIDISRLAVNSFIKTFLPVFFILLIVLFSFVMDPDKINNRLTIAGAALTGSVMFHISISNQLPPTGYLTFADKFMILTYAIFLFSFIINIALLELQERKKTELVEKVHRATEFSMLIIVPILYILLFIFLL